MSQTRHILAWVAVAGWMSIIWYLSAQPDLKSNFEQDWLLRKAAHVTEFAVLSALVTYASWYTLSRRTAVAVGALWAVAYAGIDEWHQSLVVGRHGSLGDVGIDTIGIVIVVIVFLAVTKTTVHLDSGDHA